MERNGRSERVIGSFSDRVGSSYMSKSDAYIKRATSTEEVIRKLFDPLRL